MMVVRVNPYEGIEEGGWTLGEERGTKDGRTMRTLNEGKGIETRRTVLDKRNTR